MRIALPRIVILVLLNSPNTMALPPAIEASQCGAMYRLLASVARNSNTTTLRQEKKWVIDANELTSFERFLEERYAGTLRLRDRPKEGTVNVTTTDYTRDIVVGYNSDGSSNKVKIRLRKYASKPLGEGDDSIHITEQFLHRSKLELKARHPSLDGVVFKPGVVMDDDDIKTILDSRQSFYENADRIKDKTKILTVSKSDGTQVLLNKSPEEVEELFEAIRNFHEDAAQWNRWGSNPEGLKRVSNVQYQRKAFELYFTDPTNSDQKISVQITIDSDVKFRDPASKMILASYPDSWRVVEMKMPLEYAQMSDSDLKIKIPALYELRKRASSMKQVGDIPQDTGKAASSTLIRRKLIDEEGVPTDFNAFNNAVNDGPIEINEKEKLLTGLRERNLAGYFDRHPTETRRLGQAKLKVPAPAKGAITSIREDINLMVELELNRLAQLDVTKQLAPDGKMYQELLREFKAFNRRYKNSWLTASIQEKAQLFVNAKNSNLDMQTVFQTVLQEYVTATGARDDISIISAARIGLTKFTDPYERTRAWRTFKGFAADRAAKSYMSEVVKIPVTIGSIFGVGYLCVHMEWNCPFSGGTKTSSSNITPEARMTWMNGRTEVSNTVEKIRVATKNFEQAISTGPISMDALNQLNQSLHTTGAFLNASIKKYAPIKLKTFELALNSLRNQIETRFDTASGKETSRTEWIGALADLTAAAAFLPPDPKNSLDEKISKAVRSLSPNEMLAFQTEYLRAIKDIHINLTASMMTIDAEMVR